jgi:hypothetical protein
MSMGGSRSEKYTSSLQSKSFEPLVLEETDFNMLVDIPDVVFDWENPPQVPQVEQLDGTHQHSVALWAASAAATMALHHAQTDAMILNNEKFIKILAKSNYITAVEHAEHCRAAATIVVNLEEVERSELTRHLHLHFKQLQLKQLHMLTHCRKCADGLRTL